jgi:hypothetical protein
VLSVIVCVCASQKNRRCAPSHAAPAHHGVVRTLLLRRATMPGFPGQLVQQTTCRHLLLREHRALTTLPVEHIHAGRCPSQLQHMRYAGVSTELKALLCLMPAASSSSTAVASTHLVKLINGTEHTGASLNMCHGVCVLCLQLCACCGAQARCIVASTTSHVSQH